MKFKEYLELYKKKENNEKLNIIQQRNLRINKEKYKGDIIRWQICNEKSEAIFNATKHFFDIEKFGLGPNIKNYLNDSYGTKRQDK